MAEEQEGGSYGIITVISIVLLLFALLGIAWVYFGKEGAISKTKEATKKFLPEIEDLERIKEEVFNADELKIKKEEEAKDEIFAFFEDAFNKAKSDECVHEIDFSSLKDKDFELEFSETSSGTNIKVVRESRDNQIRVYNREYKHLACFYDVEYKGFEDDPNKERNNFWLVNEFQNILVDGKEKELILGDSFTKPVLYRTKGRVCFVGKDALPEINIYKKDGCELGARISELEKVEPDDENFIAKSVELVALYFMDRKFWNVLDYYIFLYKYANLDDIQKDRIRMYRVGAISELDPGGGWVLCKIKNKHTCTTMESDCDAGSFPDLNWPQLPQEFNSLTECEDARYGRVSTAEAVTYVVK